MLCYVMLCYVTTCFKAFLLLLDLDLDPKLRISLFCSLCFVYKKTVVFGIIRFMRKCSLLANVNIT